MLNDADEMRLKDEVIGLRAELLDANYHREKAVAADALLRENISELEERLRAIEQNKDFSLRTVEDLRNRLATTEAELVSIRQSRTWRVGKVVLAPFQLLRRQIR